MQVFSVKQLTNGLKILESVSVVLVVIFMFWFRGHYGLTEAGPDAAD